MFLRVQELLATGSLHSCEGFYVTSHMQIIRCATCVQILRGIDMCNLRGQPVYGQLGRQRPQRPDGSGRRVPMQNTGRKPS